MTNILLLPQLDGNNTTFTICNNADWLDTLCFLTPGSSAAPITLIGVTTTGQNTYTITSLSPIVSTVGIVPGMPFAPCPGFPIGGFVGAVVSSTQLTLVNAIGGALFSTITDAEVPMTFFPLVIDLTGIEFLCHVRPSPGSGVLHLRAQTADGTLINGGTSGLLSFNILQQTMSLLPARSLVVDIIAIADGHTINLFPNAPATCVVQAGVTTPH
jgi:hypothetical protein